MDMHIKEPINTPKKDLSPLIEPIEPPGFIEAADKYSDICKKEEVVVVPEESKDEKKQLTIEELQLAFDAFSEKIRIETKAVMDSELFKQLSASIAEVTKIAIALNETIALNEAIAKLNQRK